MITYFAEIMNSYVGRIGLAYSKNGCAMDMNPVLQKVSPAEITAGMKVYNYDRTMYFTLDLNETLIITDIIDGHYNKGQKIVPARYSPTLEVSDYKGQLQIVVKHFENNTPTFLTIGLGEEPFISYKGINSQGQPDQHFQKITVFDMKVILKWLEMLPIWKASVMATTKYNKWVAWEEWQRKKKQQQYQSNSYFKNNQPYTKTYTNRGYSGQQNSYSYRQKSNPSGYSQQNIPQPPSPPPTQPMSQPIQQSVPNPPPPQNIPQPPSPQETPNNNVTLDFSAPSE